MPDVLFCLCFCKEPSPPKPKPQSQQREKEEKKVRVEIKILFILQKVKCLISILIGYNYMTIFSGLNVPNVKFKLALVDTVVSSLFDPECYKQGFYLLSYLQPFMLL